jgi:hypothetical protein
MMWAPVFPPWFEGLLDVVGACADAWRWIVGRITDQLRLLSSRCFFRWF